MIKTADEVLQELNSICAGWRITWDGTEYFTELGTPESIVYVFKNQFSDYYNITVDYRPSNNVYHATHGGVTYNDNRSQSGEPGRTAAEAYENLHKAIVDRANNILTMASEMNNKRNK